MYLDPSTLITDVPALQVRNFLKAESRYEFSSETAASRLKLTAGEADRLIATLLARGLIKPSDQQTGYFELTLDGGTFANASCAQPLTRKTAERRLSGLIARARHVNADRYYLFGVARVSGFGSYLSDEPRINDIDLVIELRAKEPNRDRQFELERQRIHEARMNGRAFSNIVSELFWPQHEVLLFLKARSRAYSFHAATDAVLKRVQLTKLFDADESLAPV